VSAAGVPLRIWAEKLSPETRRQLERLAQQPYVVGFVAAMADAHLSEGVAVGTVFATEREVVPRALGGDLGCGMSALHLGAPPRPPDRNALERWVAALDRSIPSGDAMHAAAGAVPLPAELLATPLSTRALEHTREHLGPRHLGTLGGGNHFVELDHDAEGDLWLLVHSGSRGMGAAVAAHHARAAGDADDPFASLSTECEAGRRYLADLAWALAFARANREALTRRAADLARDLLGVGVGVDTGGEGAAPLDVPHNFVARERWDQRDLWVHRKGAIRAAAGELALVPGSMGTASYLVEGLGCPASYGSCSHGAGRVLSRKEARARIDPRRFAASMAHVVHPRGRGRALVEEAPAAYRDIARVLDQQKDLVRRRLRLEPLAVFKG
jgi:tRNA-splicing ligase RtcB